MGRVGRYCRATPQCSFSCTVPCFVVVFCDTSAVCVLCACSVSYFMFVNQHHAFKTVLPL